MCDQCNCGETNAENSFEERVKQVIEEVRPALKDHGGDVELVDVDADGVVHVRLLGACVGCPSSSMTLTLGIERSLKNQIPEVTGVVCA